jgi:adenine-specific DNA-methyltransferase
MKLQQNLGNKLIGPWTIKEKDFWELENKGGIYWTTGGDEQPYGKIYLSESKGQICLMIFWGIDFGTNQRGSLEVGETFK